MAVKLVHHGHGFARPGGGGREETPDETLDKAQTSPLEGDESSGGHGGDGHASEGGADQALSGRGGVQTGDQERDAKRGKSNLSDQFRRDVNHGCGRSPACRKPLECSRARADHQAAKMRERQQLAAGVAHHARPDEQAQPADTPRLFQAEPGRSEKSERQARIGDENGQAPPTDAR
jgi:hypothetical protein